MSSRFLLFNASAGSGKTYNLAVQYIVLLVRDGGREYAHTLAVTFTNKATAEMKDRILEQLWGIGHQHPDSDNYLHSVQEELHKLHVTLSDDEVRERCRQALECILHDYSRFSVSTIDAFFQNVLRNMAHELGLNARLQVDLGDKQVIELAVNNIIDSLRHDDTQVLPWLKAYIKSQMDDGKKWDVRGQLSEIAQFLFQEMYLTRELDPDNKPLTRDAIQAFRKELDRLKKECVDKMKQAATSFDNIMRSNGFDYKDLLNYSGDELSLFQKILSGETDITMGKRLLGYLDNPTDILRTKLRSEASLHGIAGQLVDQLRQIHDAAPTLATIQSARQNLTPLGLLNVIDEEVARINADNNQFMLAKTPILLKKMIQDDDSSFVFEKMGTRYRNIMIDEFQDTSNLQWANFGNLIINALANGGFQMLVGDIKQSIYRWRNGDWKILHNQVLKVKRSMEQQEDGVELRPLSENRRSQRGIIDFNNAFFPQAAVHLDQIANDSAIQLSTLYADVQQQVNDRKDWGGYVRVRTALEANKDNGGIDKEDWTQLMLADLCEQIQKLHGQGIEYKQMALVFRKRKFIQPTLEYFAQHLPDVPLVSDEAFLLGSAISVQMLVAALQVIGTATPDAEGTLIIQHPVALRYLMKHYQRDVMHQTTATENDYCLASPADILPADFLDHLHDLQQTPLYELCERLYALLHLSEIPFEDAYLFTFFDELSSYLRDQPADILSFLAYWDDKLQSTTIPSGEVNGIRIFTVHKSKGLQFHTVFMPFCDWQIEYDMQGEKMWARSGNEQFDQLGTLPINISGMDKTLYHDAYQFEHLQRRADELNALYVAFTRAEHNLYIWGLYGKEGIDDKSTVADLIQLTMQSMPQNLTSGQCTWQTEELEGTHVYTLTGPSRTTAKTEDKKTEKVVNRMAPHFTEQPIQMCSYDAHVEFRQSQAASKFIRLAGEEFETIPQTEDEAGQPIDRQQMSYIEKGKLLHFVFSEIETENDVQRVLDTLQEQGLFERPAQRREAERLVQRGLQQNRVKEWFSGRYRLFNECNILTRDPETDAFCVRRPDRVMMNQDRIIVVDFKFGKPNPDYQNQVREYMDILHSMHPDKHIEGWLWYVYSGKTEEVDFNS